MSKIPAMVRNDESERALLGSCIVDPDALLDAADVVSAADFYDPRHVAVWSALQALQAAKAPIDIVTVSQAVNGRADVEFLVDITDACGSTMSAKHHAQQVALAAEARRQWQRLAQLGSAAREQTAEEFLAAVSGFGADGPEPKVTAMESIADVIQRAWAEDNGESETASKTPTAVPWLDELLDGGYTAAMHVVAARPGQGKTSLATQIAVGVAAQGVGEVLFFCVEMPNTDQVRRLAAQVSDVPLRTITKKQHNDESLAGYRDAFSGLSALPIRMRDVNVTVQSIVAESRRSASRGKVALVVVDYYQRIRSDSRSHSRLDELVKISTELADLARTINAPVLVLAQLNRDVEKSKRMPTMADLADCSQLEKDAYTITCPIIPEKMGMSQDKGEAIAVLLKNKSGPSGRTRDGALRWEGAHVRFVGK